MGGVTIYIYIYIYIYGFIRGMRGGESCSEGVG